MDRWELYVFNSLNYHISFRHDVHVCVKPILAEGDCYYIVRLSSVSVWTDQGRYQVISFFHTERSLSQTLSTLICRRSVTGSDVCFTHWLTCNCQSDWWMCRHVEHADVPVTHNDPIHAIAYNQNFKQLITCSDGSVCIVQCKMIIGPW